MKTKHTQGEWNVTESGLELMIETDSTAIAEVYTSSKEFEANAKLIAAAPDLLKEGIETRDLLWEHFQQLPQALKNKLNDWRAAIKKATE